MAIYFNDKILEPKANGTSLERKYYQELGEVKKLFARFKRDAEKGSLTFSRDFRKVYNNSKTSYKPAPPIAIPMNASMYDPEIGSIEIRYSRRPPIKSGQNTIWQRDQDSMVFETMTIDEQRADLVWFLLYASDFIKKGIVKLVDKEVEYEGTVEKMKKQMDASFAIFSEDVTYDKLKTIADLVYPKGELAARTTTQTELSAKLWSLVLVNEEQNNPGGFDALIKAAKQVEEMESQKPVSEDSEKITIELVTGESFEVPYMKCPTRRSNKELKEKAVELGIADEGLTRDMLYSLIKHKMVY